MRFKSLAIVALALALVGCQPGLGDKDFVGKWTSKVTVSDAELLKQIKASGGTEKNLPEAKKFIESINVDLEMKQDKSYTMGQGAGLVEGKWAFANTKLTLTPEKIAGVSIQEWKTKNPQAKGQADPINLDPGKDAKALTGSVEGGAGLSFTKVADKK